MIDDEAAAQELLDLIDPDRVDAQERADGDGPARGATAAGDGTAPKDAAAAPADRPA